MSDSMMTKRPTSPFMENWLYREIPVLDHGHIVLTDYMGDEAAIVESARISYGAGTRSVSNDIGLLRYLMRNRHSTPFESCEIKVKMKLPIFVARQLVRHRTASINEYSARYSVLSDEVYIPDASQILPQSTNNKQGRATTTYDEAVIAKVQTLIGTLCKIDYAAYKALLAEDLDFSTEVFNGGGPGDPLHKLESDIWELIQERKIGEFNGIARELARMVLPLNIFTQWIWKIDLHNLMYFIGLRSDAHAQYEIRVYSDKLREILQGWLPNVMSAFSDYQMNAVNLSAPEWAAIKHIITSNSSTDALGFSLQQDNRISKRETDALMARISQE